LVDKRLFLPEPWFADVYQARRTTCKLPEAVVWQSKPPLAAAMVQDLHQAGILSFTYRGADCLDGNSPAFWAACEACVGTVAFVATPADTRGGCNRSRPRPTRIPRKECSAPRVSQ
jgi:hypothetical protein